jgi:hypothetical protein
MKAIPSTKKTLRSVEHAITRVTTKLDDVPINLKGARKTLLGWHHQGTRLAKKHPLRAALGAAVGAFAAGIALTALARRG